jgi:hypothetical protein
VYREALNRLSLRYQFLCYYKIIEGITARRGRLSAAAVDQGLSPPRIFERMPADPEGRGTWFEGLSSFRPEIDDFILDNTFPAEVLGKKITYVRDQFLRPALERVGPLMRKVAYPYAILRIMG